MKLTEILDESLHNFVNLTFNETGIRGTIYITSAEGNSGPHIKWFPERAGRNKPCLIATISREPQFQSKNLPDVIINSVKKSVENWIKINYTKLLNFWNTGETWYHDEVMEFVDTLIKEEISKKIDENEILHEMANLRM